MPNDIECVRKERSLTSIVEQSIAAVDQHKSLNAYTYVDRYGARTRAHELDAQTDHVFPLKGFVLAIKDNIHVAGMPSSAGTASLRGFYPQKSASVVERLIQNGAIILGKSGMHELAYGITSNNFEFGPVRNPVDESKIPGGSSGGSAAAVRAGLARAALGTDTGGSVRLPAALTGTFGFRPSIGRYSQDGILLISPTRDTIGLITNSVADTILLDGVIVGSTPKVKSVDLSSLRLGIPRKYFYEDLDPDVEHVSTAFLKKLEALGVVLVQANVADIQELNKRVGFPIALYETSRAVPEYLEKYKTGIELSDFIKGIKSPDVQNIMTTVFSGKVSLEQYEAALEYFRPKLQATYKAYFNKNNVDAILFPTSPITARNIAGILDGVVVNGELKDTFSTYIHNTDPASNAGLPGISIPAGLSSDGLPVGMELDAREGDDEHLLSIALAIEIALNGDDEENKKNRACIDRNTVKTN